MPDEIVTTPIENPIRTEQEVSLLLQKIIGQDNTPPLNETQVSEVLAQRRQIADFVHQDRKRESYDSKFILLAVLNLYFYIFCFDIMEKTRYFFRSS